MVRCLHARSLLIVVARVTGSSIVPSKPLIITIIFLEKYCLENASGLSNLEEVLVGIPYVGFVVVA